MPHLGTDRSPLRVLLVFTQGGTSCSCGAMRSATPRDIASDVVQQTTLHRSEDKRSTSGEDRLFGGDVDRVPANDRWAICSSSVHLHEIEPVRVSDA